MHERSQCQVLLVDMFLLENDNNYYVKFLEIN